jgi:hypothetical protein
MMASRQNVNPNGGRMSLAPNAVSNGGNNNNKRQSMSSATLARQSMAPTTGGNR